MVAYDGIYMKCTLFAYMNICCCENGFNECASSFGVSSGVSGMVYLVVKR